MQDEIVRDVPRTDSPLLIRPSELCVVRLIIKGKTNKEIANELDRSEKTIEKHRHNILIKLGCLTMPQAIHQLHLARMLP
jgi:DNA-binding NarL/FixJ family response regulator